MDSDVVEKLSRKRTITKLEGFGVNHGENDGKQIGIVCPSLGRADHTAVILPGPFTELP